MKQLLCTVFSTFMLQVSIRLAYQHMEILTGMQKGISFQKYCLQEIASCTDLGVVVYVYDPSTLETEESRVRGPPELHSETV